MSSYVDIYNDYPLRCAELWKNFNDSAEKKNLDVTFMLMCAAGGFATPWEHLRIQPGQTKELRGHPAFHNFDEIKFKRSAKTMEDALERMASSSPLFENVRIEDCFYGRCDGIELIRDMAEHRNPNSYLIQTEKALNLVRILRNALAHNNIHAFARGRSSEISEVTFFSQFVDKGSRSKKCEKCERKFVEPMRRPYSYEVLSMPVREFHAFLTSWFDLLRVANPKGNYLKPIVTNALETDHEPIAAYG